ncbi:hypothetical protein E0L36_09985 [Streptomyces sp. AJS327]|uniref:endonuclease/exonuclease/phosphatase family protein n=1 Tax=Streptomyces sp. AJS327 TaxID=2545265 RepID=UPI0015DFEA1E|nr:endonuclease/exonuclease/phosphatase family protein [Streptomyces sp. AJS327]MBA0051212.1 hypothetical protein [Streptomyces sp. AJS327]
MPFSRSVLRGLSPLGAVLAASVLVPALTVPAQAAPRPAPQRTLDVRVETYNTCGHGCLPTLAECEAVIGRDCATKLEPWAEGRAARVAADVSASRADVVSTQEIGNNATPTQPGVDVESFRAPLTAAMTERGYAQAPADYAGTRHPSEGYPLKSGAGRFTYYDAQRFSHLDARGRELPHDLLWLPDSTEIYGKTMTWNTLRERATGARFVVVNMHLEYRKKGATDPNGWTRDWDRVRYDDARRTIQHLTRDNPATRKLPVVFAGDMNSDSREAGASPHAAFTDAGYADAFDTAKRRSGAEYRSFNGGGIPLPRGESKIDYVFVKNGTAVRDWTLTPQTDAPAGEPRDLLRSDHNQINATVRLPVVTR